MNSKIQWFFIVNLFIVSGLYCQENAVNRSGYQLNMNEIEEEIILDGVLDEKTWEHAEVATHFHMVTPVDDGYPKSESEVRMAHNQNYLYVAIVCHDTIPGKRPVESLRRDFSFGKNDNFIVFIDTYNDQTNGFAFGISAVGAQWEGIQADGGFVSLNWDTKWKSAVKNYEDKWIAEFEIPYRSIRYKEGATEWGINFSRLDLKTGEKSAWAPVPRQFQTANLAFTGTLRWDKPLGKRGIRYAAIPYVFGQATQISGEEDSQYQGKIGMDAKVTLSTSLNLDLTFNPDFSQVDVDQQQINLDRFELFFPERRQFFLENSDLFASLGNDSNRPFFSRRIGLNNPVRAGARLSGKITENSRIGIMNIQTGTQENIPASNFTVGVFQQKILTRSNVSVFMLNKSITDPDVSGEENSFNRVAGLEFNLFSPDNKWVGKLFYHQAFYENAGANAFTTSARLLYDTPKFGVGINQSYIGRGYQADIGFVRRTGVLNTQFISKYRFFPKGSKITTHGIDLEFEIFTDEDLILRDRETELSYSFTWVDRSNLEISVEETFIKLINSFDPTNTGGVQLLPESEYNWQTFRTRFTSNQRDLFNFQLGGSYGGFFNGTRLNIEGELSYRYQPFVKLSLLAEYNDINLPLPFNSADFYLVGPKLDITFTDKLFLTAFTQYNNQIDNLNVNVRFQWRFAPVSDFFIVYTQNTFTEDFVFKDRGIAAKVSYWIN